MRAWFFRYLFLSIFTDIVANDMPILFKLLRTPMRSSTYWMQACEYFIISHQNLADNIIYLNIHQSPFFLTILLYIYAHLHLVRGVILINCAHPLDCVVFCITATSHECHGVPNHRQLDCSLNSLYILPTQKTLITCCLCLESIRERYPAPNGAPAPRSARLSASKMLLRK